MTEITRGLCACGCGLKTALATKTDAARGAVKGEPLRWVKGHNRRRHPVGSACITPGCDRTPEARGLCHSHFEWSRRNDGAIPESGVIHETDRERFEAKVQKLPSGHWIWTGAKSIASNGNYYGTARWKGRGLGAHRVAWFLYREELPGGYELVIDHLCRVTLCVNPDHLEATTQQINTLRGDSVQAKNAAKTHCVHGHELSGDNLMIRKRGGRDCRECHRRRVREAMRRYRAKNT